MKQDSIDVCRYCFERDIANVCTGTDEETREANASEELGVTAVGKRVQKRIQLTASKLC